MAVDEATGTVYIGLMYHGSEPFVDRGIFVIDTNTLAVTRTMDAGGPPVNVAVGDGPAGRSRCQGVRDSR